MEENLSALTDLNLNLVKEEKAQMVKMVKKVVKMVNHQEEKVVKMVANHQRAEKVQEKDHLEQYVMLAYAVVLPNKLLIQNLHNKKICVERKLIQLWKSIGEAKPRNGISHALKDQWKKDQLKLKMCPTASSSPTGGPPWASLPNSSHHSLSSFMIRF